MAGDANLSGAARPAMTTVAEEGTASWYAFKISDTSYGIFDTFATDDARTAHINGQIPAALAKVSADLLASDPDIRPVEVLAFK